MQRLRRHLKNAFIPHHGNDYRPHALRRPMLHMYTAIVVAVKIIAVVFVAVYASPARVSDISPSTIATLTNAARQQNKLGLLKSNAALTKAAQAKASDMAKKQYFAHVSPTGLTPWTWFKRAGYSYTYAGENLAMDFVTSEDVIAAWLRSPSHRKNLLSTKYKDIGVAVTTANINGAPSLLVVQMFGAPVPAQPKRVVTTPAQTPSPTAAKTTARQAPQQVLGEATTATPPTVPTITSPAHQTMIRTAFPEVVGQAESGSIVTLFVNGIRQATTTTGSDGVYAVMPSVALTDGAAAIQVTATARGLTSSLSGVVATTIDTAAPNIDTEQTILLPSYDQARGYDVLAAVSGEPSVVSLRLAGMDVALTPTAAGYFGAVPMRSADTNPVVTVRLADAAGNSSEAIVADTSIFSNGVVASTSGPFVATVRVLFYSRTFLVFVLVLLFVVATLNIAIEWRHQHHPTIIHSLLLLFVVGTFLVI